MALRYAIAIFIVLSAAVGGVALSDLSGDGMPVYKDMLNGTNPLDSDTDSDGLTDAEEIEEYETDPLNADTDGDGLSDSEEIENHNTDPTDRDTDDDQLSDGQEVKAYETNPRKADTDGDGLDDYTEINETNTYPTRADTDEDGLQDGEEIQEYETDPTDGDTDDDGLSDGQEVEVYNTDPLNADTDGDKLTDYEEVSQYETDPTKVDTDDDSLTDYEEVTEYNTDPTKFDTDGDNLSDSQEIELGTDPRKKDTDEDLLNDGQEVEIGTNPTEPDTSGDGFRDGIAYRESSLDPLKYNMVVEVSYMEGVNVPREELRKMEVKFESAPVMSGGDKEGVNFVMMVDEEPVEARSSITLEEYTETYYQSDFESGQGRFHVLFARDVKSGSNERIGGVTSTSIDGAIVADLDSGEHETYATMHELGHQLGLLNDVYSGVDSREKSWEEYPSVMNYNRPDPWKYQYSDGQGHDDWEYIEQNFAKNQADHSKLIKKYQNSS